MYYLVLLAEVYPFVYIFFVSMAKSATSSAGFCNKSIYKNKSEDTRDAALLLVAT